MRELSAPTPIMNRMFRQMRKAGMDPQQLRAISRSRIFVIDRQEMHGWLQDHFRHVTKDKIPEQVRSMYDHLWWRLPSSRFLLEWHNAVGDPRGVTICYCTTSVPTEVEQCLTVQWWAMRGNGSAESSDLDFIAIVQRDGRVSYESRFGRPGNWEEIAHRFSSEVAYFLVRWQNEEKTKAKAK